jgi:putative ABC transport system permease protein
VLAYQLRIAWKSLRRGPAHTLIVAGGIALGVAVSTLFATVRHSFTREPVPGKSDSIHAVRMDSWGPDPYPGGGPPSQVTYRDMTALLRSDIPVRQTGTFKSALYVFPDPKVGRPRKEMVRLCFADFFPMFEPPFRHGGPWTAEADRAAERVVVLSDETNQRLFGGEDSVGRSVRIEDRDFRVVGVLDRWRPSIKPYDLTQNPTAPPEGLYIPFNHLVPMELQSSGNSDGWRSPPAPGFAGFLQSEQVWILLWVELDSAEAVARYRAFLDAYTLEQRKGGRFQRPLDNRVTSLSDLVVEQKIMPAETNAMVAVSLLFLLICALNLVGLLLGKFLARAAEIGVRRAMGARRLDVFVQHILECELIALVGGLAGLALARGAVAVVNVWAGSIIGRTDFLQMDWIMAGFAVAAGLVAGLVAGLYPAARVCRIAPAIHLKTQ